MKLRILSHLQRKADSKSNWLYHLVNQERMIYILNSNALTPYNYVGGISTTTNPEMDNYLGSGALVLFRLVLDRKKIESNFEVKAVKFRSATGVTFEEDEEFIEAPRGIPNLSQYLVEIRILSTPMARWKKWMENPEDDWDKRLAREFYDLMKRLPKYCKVVEV